MAKPSKTIPVDGLLSRKRINDGEILPTPPENCYYKVEFDYDYSHTDFWLQTRTKVEIPNPKYETELIEYNKIQEKIKHQELEKEKRERVTYEYLKKKFEGKNG